MLLVSPMVVESSNTRVRCSRLTSDPGNSGEVRFSMNTSFREKSVSGSKMTLVYTIVIETYPLVERAELGGDVTVELPAIGNAPQVLTQSLLTELAIQLYRKNYDTLYLIFESLGLRPPSPWMIRDVHFVR